MTVRCVRLLKPYIKKGVAEEDDDDDEDEDDDGGAGRGGLLTEGRIMEKDLLTQAYHISMFDLFLKLRNKVLMLLLVKANTSVNTAIFFSLCSKPLHEGADLSFDV